MVGSFNSGNGDEYEIRVCGEEEFHVLAKMDHDELAHKGDKKMQIGNVRSGFDLDR